MTSDQLITEMYSKTATSAHPFKEVMMDMICIAMAYETVCSTARSTASDAGNPYVPHTFVEYQTLIDRAAHAAYILADGAAAAGAVLLPDPFVLKLAEAHDDLTVAIDGFITGVIKPVVFTTGDALVIAANQLAQQAKIDRGVAGLMNQ
jgi:hypothetical protein